MLNIINNDCLQITLNAVDFTKRLEDAKIVSNFIMWDICMFLSYQVLSLVYLNSTSLKGLHVLQGVASENTTNPACLFIL